MKAVLDTKSESVYDDEIATRYHFPPRYLAIMKKCVGDWVIFRRPRAGGEGISYFATGLVSDIYPDPAKTNFHFAKISNFLAFDRPVAWRHDGRYAEVALRVIENVQQVGLYLRGKSVRQLEDSDFIAIVESGLAVTLDPANAANLGLDAANLRDGDWAARDLADQTSERRTVAMLVNRKIREASFRGAVCRAYDNRCAVTGIRIVNGGGRSEVQAAHILPVALGGPDIVQNGIALSSTAHWLFDRHLISVAEDYSLLVSHNKVPAELKTLFAPQADRVRLPVDPRLWPSQRYLAAHRERFGGS
jgi:putative restriction endonuclease